MVFLFVIISSIVGIGIVQLFYHLSGAANDDRNKYIRLHQARIKNKKQYRQYLRWMSKHGHELPIDEVKSRAEIEFENELNDLMKGL